MPPQGWPTNGSHLPIPGPAPVDFGAQVFGDPADEDIVMIEDMATLVAAAVTEVFSTMLSCSINSSLSVSLPNAGLAMDPPCTSLAESGLAAT